MSAAPDAAPDTTEDLLLGGRVRLRQPRAEALRATQEPVFLAAAVPARRGETVLEAGCGTGAGFLCLAARVPGLMVRAVERDAALAALARENAALNGLAGAEVALGDVRSAGLARRLGPCAHAFANPPWWPEGTAPPAARRGGATHATSGGAADLTAWAVFLAGAVVPGGTVTLVLPAARFDAGLAALSAAGCGAARLVPLWPRAGEPAKRVLVQARRERRGPARLEAGLVLHVPLPGQGFTPEADAVLRGAAPLTGDAAR